MRMDVAQQLTAYLPALLTIAAIMLGIAYNNKRIDHLDTRIGDLKELFKAEIRAEGARLELALGGRLDRIEQRLDTLGERVGHLEEQRLIR
jgi:hypothetical protein